MTWIDLFMLSTLVASCSALIYAVRLESESRKELIQMEQAICEDIRHLVADAVVIHAEILDEDKRHRQTRIEA